MTRVWGIRGATTSDSDTREAILDATEELLRELSASNDLDPDDLATAIFTVTPDLTAAFPAEVARVRMQWTDGAFLSATEIPVPDAPERCIRVLLLVNTDKDRDQIKHAYLRGASGLRQRGVEPSDR
jgi:chorismate mutase